MVIFAHYYMNHYTKNIIGIKVSRLIILERVGKNKHGAQLLRCLCDCGNETIVTYSNFFRKDAKRTRSCGCFAREQSFSKQTWEVEFRRYEKGNAQKRGLDFNLTLDQFKVICNLQCFYCKADPQIKTHVGTAYRSSIDRLDSSIGYLKTNCVPCCAVCQFMKGSLSYDDFINQIKIINQNIALPD
jgi:hypothetical protein